MKRVIVVFRGTVNAHNWGMNARVATNEWRNPVKENYPGRSEKISLHSGFAMYLLRKRKDTRMSTLEKICDKVDKIGREMAPDGSYNIAVTGHSLGGALATLFGFYAATRPLFAHLGSAIYVWTFACELPFIHATASCLSCIHRILHLSIPFAASKTGSASSWYA